MSIPKIVLIPLDERPVNTRYPKMIAAIGGAELFIPPKELLGYSRTPANLDAVDIWLRDIVSIHELSAALISCDFLGYGNLINSRISNDSAAQAISRLSILEALHEKVTIHAFSLITRVSNANDNVEEPLYWKDWGEKFYAYSGLSHRAELGDHLNSFDQAMLDGLSSELPQVEKSDWQTRRLRNHTVNLVLIDMAARGRIDSLLLTSDDTAPFGYPSREREWLAKWCHMIGADAESRIQMHPGADEVGSALVAKTINLSLGWTPKVWVVYSIPDDCEIVALYEDRPISSTVIGQIEACGCIMADSPQEADFILGAVTPSPRRIDYRKEIADQDALARAPFYRAFLNQLSDFQKLGIPVALADVAFPNGSDPQLTEMLLRSDSPLSLGDLAAYGAWNTAGNTIGTVVAQASSNLTVEDQPDRIKAQTLFLTHRFLEDYGYQQIVRREARGYSESLWGRREPNPDSQNEQVILSKYIEGRLNTILSELQSNSIGQGVSIRPDSVFLPWGRTFEVDFDLIIGD